MLRLMDRDLVTAMVLFAIALVFWGDSGQDAKDWGFPLLASYLLFGIAALLFGRVVFAAVMKRAPDIMRMTPEDRLAYRDVLVFFVIVLVYMFVLYGLGFWLASLLMLTLTSLYLTLERTRRNLISAVLTPVVACIAAYIIFLHVFYVPFPRATWWAGLMGE